MTHWLELEQLGLMEECPNPIAVKCWNLMGGEVDWAALPILCEVFGIDDVDLFVHELCAIREHMRARQDVERT